MIRDINKCDDTLNNFVLDKHNLVYMIAVLGSHTQKDPNSFIPVYHNYDITVKLRFMKITLLL